MNKSRKKILLLLLISFISISSIMAEKITFNITSGDIKSLSIYNEFGKVMPLYSKNNIPLSEKLILRTYDEDIEIDYKYGTLNISANSIVTISPNESIPLIYVIDGQITIDTNSFFIQEYNVLTPVSKYKFNSPAKIKIISTEDLEYGIFLEGEGSSYNALTNQTTLLSSAQLIDMGNNNNIKLDIPSEYLKANINIDNDKTIVSLIESEYAYKEELLKEENIKISEDLRTSYLNNNYLLDLSPIQKSNDFNKITTINLIVTGNGQGNVSFLDLPSLSGIIQTAREQDKNILLIDAGNTLRGSTFVNFDKGKTATKILDMIGYDIIVPGAMDFSNGINQLQQLDIMSDINFISSNAMNNDNLLYFNPYGLYLFDNFKIAVLGLSSPSDITDIMEVNLTNEVVIDNAQKAIDAAKEVADYVILVSNMRTEDFNSAIILNNLSGIDLLIDGSDNDASYTKINNTPIIKTGVGYSEIQNFIINVKDTEVLSTNYIKVFSSNLNEPSNRLITSLDLTNFNRDINLSNYLSLIKVPSNLSQFLIAPEFVNNFVYSDDIDNLLEVKDTDEITDIEEVEAKEDVLEPITDELSEKPEIVEEVEISAPNFNPISYKVKKQEIRAISNDLVEEKTEVIKEDSTKITTNQLNIYTEESNSLKTNIGIISNLEGSVEVKSSPIAIDDYYAQLTLYPYISRGGFSLSLKAEALLDKNLDYTFNFDTLPTNTREAFEYSLDLFNELKIYSPSDKFNLDINRNSYYKTIDSAIIYHKIGGDDVHIASKIDMGSTSLKINLSDINLFKPLNDETIENAYLSINFYPVESIKIGIDGIVIGNSSDLDLLPSLNFDFIPINNKDLQIKFNLGATTLLEMLPTFNYNTFIDPTNNLLIPNYLANTSLTFNTENLNLSLQANYLVTEDKTKFSTNMIHNATIRDVYNAVDTNTLSAITKINYTKDNSNFNLIYTIPFDASTFNFTNDLLDIDLALNINDITIGGYFLQNNAFNYIKNIADFKTYLINNDTEYGAYLSYDIKDFKIKTNLTVPATGTNLLKVDFIVNHKLNFSL